MHPLCVQGRDLQEGVQGCDACKMQRPKESGCAARASMRRLSMLAGVPDDILSVRNTDRGNPDRSKSR